MPFIPLETFTNQASTTVSAGGTTAPSGGTVETWTVASSASFPPAEYGAQEFHVADPAAPTEIIAVLGVSGTTWTVMRGTEGTTPVTHAAGFTVQQVVTAGTLAGLQYPAWQFPVQAYGAQGDGKVGAGGTGSAGSSAFSDAGAAFVNAAAPAGDIGKLIIINTGAGSAATPRPPWTGTITAVTSATSVTLSSTLNAAATSAPYIYGTDDAAAIRAAVDAAEAWAKSTGNYKAQVVFEPQNYMLGSLYQMSSPNTYNTHIRVPFSGPYEQRITIDFIGTGDAAEPMFWGSATPNISGTCLVSAVNATGQPNGTYGQQSILGGPSTQTGISAAGLPGCEVANVLVNISGITAVAPYNAQQYGFHFTYCAQSNVEVGAAVAFAPVNYTAQPCGGTWLRAATVPTNGVAVGLALPHIGNNDNCNVGLFSAEGFARGMSFGEHVNITRLATIYCADGIYIPGLGADYHGGTIRYWSCEGCINGINTDGGGGAFTLNIFSADFEAMTGSVVTDSGDALTGFMFYDSITPSPQEGAGVSGAAHYKIIATKMYPGPWVADGYVGIPAPPAAPSTGVAQQNTCWRDCTLYLSATSGITGVSVGPASTGLTALGITAGNNVVTMARVPSGHWYSVAYSGTLTVKWYRE